MLTVSFPYLTLEIKSGTSTTFITYFMALAQKCSEKFTHCFLSREIFLAKYFRGIIFRNELTFTVGGSLYRVINLLKYMASCRIVPLYSCFSNECFISPEHGAAVCSVVHLKYFGCHVTETAVCFSRFNCASQTSLITCTLYSVPHIPSSAICQTND